MVRWDITRHTDLMATTLARQRASSDIDVVSRAGLALPEFLDEATTTLQRVVPFVAACLSTLDPATAMVSRGWWAGTTTT